MPNHRFKIHVRIQDPYIPRIVCDKCYIELNTRMAASTELITTDCRQEVYISHKS